MVIFSSSIPTNHLALKGGDDGEKSCGDSLKESFAMAASISM